MLGFSIVILVFSRAVDPLWDQEKLAPGDGAPIPGRMP